MKKLIIILIIILCLIFLAYQIVRINNIAESFNKNSMNTGPKQIFGLKIPKDISYENMMKLMKEDKIKAAYSIEGRTDLYLVTDDGIYTTNIERNETEKFFSNANIPYKQARQTIIEIIFSIIMQVGITVLVFAFMLLAVNKIMGNGINNKIGETYIPKTTFADVAGNEEAKENLLEMIDCIKNPEKYAKFGVSIPRGTLLIGPPGNGKTLMAKALAGTAKMSFISVSGSEFVQLYVGLGAMRVRNLFERARKSAPCIIFIDEIDAIGKTRGGVNGHDERDQTLNQLLTEMDGFTPNEKIMVLAATNRYEDLDEALLRPGRFDRQLVIDYPDYKERLQNLKLHFAKKPLAPDVNLEAIARMTTYMSGAQLENIANESGFFAVRNKHKVIENEDIDLAFNKILAGEGKKDGNQNLKEKEIAATHESGHAIIAKIIANKTVPKITIQPTTKGMGGYTLVSDDEDIKLMTKDALKKELMILMGGRAAEEIIYGKEYVTTGAANDIQKATKIAIQMICSYGMGEYGIINVTELAKYIPQSNTSAEIEKEANRLIHQAFGNAKEQISKYVPLLKMLSEKLFEEETLYEKDFMDIIKDYQLRNNAA